jgi:hypothetical protein
MPVQNHSAHSCFLHLSPFAPLPCTPARADTCSALHKITLYAHARTYTHHCTHTRPWPHYAHTAHTVALTTTALLRSHSQHTTTHTHSHSHCSIPRSNLRSRKLTYLNQPTRNGMTYTCLISLLSRWREGAWSRKQP